MKLSACRINFLCSWALEMLVLMSYPFPSLKFLVNEMKLTTQNQPPDLVDVISDAPNCSFGIFMKFGKRINALINLFVFRRFYMSQYL